MQFKLVYVGDKRETLAEALGPGDYEIGRTNTDFAKNVPYFARAEDTKKQPFGLPVTALSRRHLIMQVRANEMGLEDNRSSNGSYLNDEPFQETTIRSPGTHTLKLGGADHPAVILEVIASE